jgi:hypothetical protein
MGMRSLKLATRLAGLFGFGPHARPHTRAALSELDVRGLHSVLEARFGRMRERPAERRVSRPGRATG